MTNKKNSQAGKPDKATESLPTSPWISMRSGVLIISITSIAMGVLTAMQVVPVKGWLEGILWGLGYGAMIWIIFFGMIFVNRFLKRK